MDAHRPSWWTLLIGRPRCQCDWSWPCPLALEAGRDRDVLEAADRDAAVARIIAQGRATWGEVQQ